MPSRDEMLKQIQEMLGEDILPESLERLQNNLATPQQKPISEDDISNAFNQAGGPVSPDVSQFSIRAPYKGDMPNGSA
jgi:hypothetical protein